MYVCVCVCDVRMCVTVYLLIVCACVCAVYVAIVVPCGLSRSSLFLSFSLSCKTRDTPVRFTAKDSTRSETLTFQPKERGRKERGGGRQGPHRERELRSSALDARRIAIVTTDTTGQKERGRKSESEGERLRKRGEVKREGGGKNS